MIRKTFIVISVSDRVNHLNFLMESIMKFEKFNDYDVNLIFQDYAGNSDKIKYRERYKNIFIYKEKLGCHGARVKLLQDMNIEDYDIFINLDDDMELIKYTNYDNAIEKALEPSTGFVLTNWGKTENIVMNKISKIRKEFKKQIMVYQGGGMVYSTKIARLMRDLPVCHAHFDDIWSLTSYINGYDNYRDMSSLAIHRIISNGGMQSYSKQKIRPLLCRDYINYRYGGKNKDEVLIPEDSDLNELARELHKRNKK